MRLVIFTALPDLAPLIIYSWYVSLTAKVIQEVETINYNKTHFSHPLPKSPHTWGERSVELGDAVCYKEKQSKTTTLN